MSCSNSYKIIDTSIWKRKLHCEIFRNALQPQYSVCLELDITNFIKRVKENKWSFTLSFIHTITTCANEMEEFRYRFLNGEVVLYDTIHTSFTYLDAETELFKVVNVPMVEDIEAYITTTKATIANQKGVHHRPRSERCLSIFVLALDQIHAFLPHACGEEREIQSHVRLGQILRERRENVHPVRHSGAPFFCRRLSRGQICRAFVRPALNPSIKSIETRNQGGILLIPIIESSA